MDRRRFIKAAAATVPVLAGCVTAEEFGDPASFFRARRLGIVMLPTAASAEVSNSWSQQERAIANLAATKRIQDALPRKLDEFVPLLRTEMMRTFHLHNVRASETPYRANLGAANPAYGPPEPFYLRCGIVFAFHRVDDGLEMGARNLMALYAPGGRTLNTGRTGHHAPHSKRVPENFGTSDERFVNIDDMLLSPDRVVRGLMKLAAPLGVESAVAFLDDMKAIEAEAGKMQVPTR